MDSILKNKWTAEEENLVVELYPTSTCKQIAAILGRTLRSIEHKHGELKKLNGNPKPKKTKKHPLTIPQDQTVLAYLAGIIDGEGHIGIRYSKPTSVHFNPSYGEVIYVANTDQRLIDFLQTKCGGYVRKEIRETKRQRTVYRWFLQGPDTHQFLTAVYPFLVCKRDQAEVIFQFHQSFAQTYWKLPRHVIEFRHSCYQKLRGLHAGTSDKGRWFPNREILSDPGPRRRPSNVHV